VLLVISAPDGMRSTYPICSTSAAVDRDNPKTNVRRSDEPLRAIPKGMYKRILFKKSATSNLLSIYLSEGCRSPTGIIVAATITATEGANSRRRRRGSENSFKGRSAQGAVQVREKFSNRIYGGVTFRVYKLLLGSKQLKQRFRGRKGVVGFEVCS